LSNVKSIASFWAYLAGVIPDDRVENFPRHLTDTSSFSRQHRVPTLSADNPHFNPDGDYWNGSIWAPTNYMVLRGLTKYKKDSLAFEIGKNHVENVVKVFEATNTLNENYAPDKVQGNDKKDFVGWTGLAPITVLFEYVFGIRANVPDRTLLIDVNLLDSYGVNQYPYGQNGLLNISVQKRKSVLKRPKIMIESNIALTVMVKWEGGEFSREINVGKNKLN